jgi:hypothetical protein
MTHIPSLRSLVGAPIVDARELDRAPRALVHFGQAPDGLPWLCDVDRSSRIGQLHDTVTHLFECATIEDLPASVREATEGPLARGLMGVHAITLDQRGPQPAFVTRRNARSLFGPTILEQLLSPTTGNTPPPISSGLRAVTSVHAIGEMAEALDSAIEASKAGRHVVLTLSGETWTALVTDADRSLRVPAAPFRRATFESLAALAGAHARVRCGYDSWTAPLSDLAAYTNALVRAGDAPHGGSVEYELPRATVLKLLVGVAELIAERHARGIVHGDLTPSNVILDGSRPTSADSLDVEIGHIAAAATFEWAAPEQVTGRSLDPRADIYALGKMACALVGAVPYGEQITYRVPTGGNDAKTVELLKTDGVFIDGKALGVGRDWQAAWQDTLMTLVAYDRDRRLDGGAAAAAALGQLAERFAPPGTMTLSGRFGSIVPIQRPSTWPLARVISDG